MSDFAFYCLASFNVIVAFASVFFLKLIEKRYQDRIKRMEILIRYYQQRG